jgi:hypothetical protein
MTSCCREHLGSVSSFTHTVTAGNSVDVVTDADAAGRKYRLEDVRIVQASTATATFETSNGDDICPVASNDVGETAQYLVNDQGCAFAVTGSGSATLTGTLRWL